MAKYGGAWIGTREVAEQERSGVIEISMSGERIFCHQSNISMGLLCAPRLLRPGATALEQTNPRTALRHDHRRAVAGKRPLQNSFSLGRSATPSNTWFIGPTRVHTPNGTSISSSVLAQLTVETNRQTTEQ